MNSSPNDINDNQKLAKDIADYRVESILQLRQLRQDVNRAIGSLGREIDAISTNYTEEENESFQKGNPQRKVAFKPKRVETNRKNAYAVGAALFLMAAGVSLSPKITTMAENISTKVESNQLINDEVTSFSKNNVVPNTRHSYTYDTMGNPTSVHSHDYVKTFMAAKNLNEDPIIALYIASEAMGVDCVNQGMSVFNRLYGTTYKDVTDFLIQNNLANEKEWRTYVANRLIAEKEESLYGDNYARR